MPITESIERIDLAAVTHDVDNALDLNAAIDALSETLRIPVLLFYAFDMPTAVVPAGLPPHTILQYADVGSEHAVPRVVLNYQTEIGGQYYRTVIAETTTVSGPPVAHFEVSRKGKDGRPRHETWTVPLRRWNHGDVIMEMLPQGLPATMIDRIVRENTR